MTKHGKFKKPEGLSDGEAIAAYAEAQTVALRTICDRLRVLIDSALPKATSKIWHGGPVWFIGENPVVGYDARAKEVSLLFWNGQAFDEAELKPVGKYGAAQAIFGAAAEIEPKTIRRWLKKAKTDIFDSVGFFKKLREKKRV
jgi:hypothetical protein